MKKRTITKRVRVSQHHAPNTTAATDIVAQSVATYIATKSDSKRTEKTSQDSQKELGQTVRKRVQSKPQTIVEGSASSSDSDRKNALRAMASKRKAVVTATQDQQKLSVERKTTKKRRGKRDQSPASAAETEQTDTKQTSPKGQKQTPSPRKTSKSSVTQTSSNEQATLRKRATKKTNKRTPPKTSLTKTKDRPTELPDHNKSRTPAKKKQRKTTKTKTGVTTRRPVEMLTGDFVVGFQGIYYKPYGLASKDLFMSAAQQDHFMDILTRAKEKLVAEEADRAGQLQENDASNLPDPLDQGTNEGVFHNQLRTRDRESQLVRKINRAIDCLKTGSYGYCEACGCEIPIRRLEARPIVTKCIDCKERDELRERQLGH